MELSALRDLPKVELHNHLDGGVRVATLLELADGIGYQLPGTDIDSLSEWFYQGKSGSLERYLAAFEHTIAVMQTADAVERIAYEATQDLADDGVIYAEIRYAPVLTTIGGMSREDSIEAALAGFARGRGDTGTVVNLIVDAMRERPNSLADAAAAVRFADQGVVGFDLAGPESGFPADAHIAACRFAAESGLHLTIHAGEADGISSIRSAVEICHAERIGHGIRIIDDIAPDGSLGPLALRLRDEQVPLEVCPTSNLHTLSIAPEEHPLGRLYRAGFCVTLNTDNRLMSRVTLTDEFHLAVAYQGMSIDDLHAITRNAANAAFVDAAQRADLVARIDSDYARRSLSQ